jgi:hypothetical protein
MLMSRLGVLVGMFTMLVSGRSVLFSLFMVTVIVMMGSLKVVVCCRLMVGRSCVMMLARGVLLFLRHLKFSQVNPSRHGANCPVLNP